MRGRAGTRPRWIRARVLLALALVLLPSIVSLTRGTGSTRGGSGKEYAQPPGADGLRAVEGEFYAGGCPGISPAPDPSEAQSASWEPAPSMLSSPGLGTRNLLVVLVDFADRPGTADVGYFRTMVYGDAQGSLRHYYSEVSYGKLTVVGGVAGSGWHRSSWNMSIWGGDSGPASHDDGNACIFDLAREALILADSAVDLRAFDTNRDGVIESGELAFIVVHAGSGQEAPPRRAGDIWSHFGYIYGQGYAGRNGSALSDLMLDGIRVSKHPGDEEAGRDVGGYCMVAEDSELGTYAHEYGHALGLPDLYNGLSNGENEYLGKWDLMAGGNWNGNPPGSSPAHPSSWSKLRLGWIDQVYTLSYGERTTLTLDPLETRSGGGILALRIPAGTRYYLVEARRRTLYDSWLPDQGVLISLCNDTRESGAGPVRLVDAAPASLSLDDAPFDPAGNHSYYDASIYKILVTIISLVAGSYSVRAEYGANIIKVATSPTALRLKVNDTVYMAPQYLPSESGLTYVIEALSPMSLGQDNTTRYVFTQWSDGLNQTRREFKADGSSTTLTAEYLPQYYLKVATPLGTSSGQGWYRNGTIAYAGVTPVSAETSARTRLAFSRWTGDSSGLNGSRSDPIDMTSSRTATAEWKPQHQVSLVFATEDGRTSIIPSLCSIRGAAPNGSVLNVRGYTPLWLDDVNWTILEVSWEGSNVTPDMPRCFSPDASGTWEMLCKVQEVSFAEAFTDASGGELRGDRLRFELLAPNGTLLKDLSANSYVIQKGELQVRNVSWRGVDVTQSYSTFNPGVDAPRIKCSVYDLAVRIRDVLGLPISASVTARLAEGSTEMASGEAGLTGTLTLTQLPKGTYVVEASTLGGRDTGNTLLSQETQVNLRVGLGYPSIGIFLLIAVVLGAIVRRLRRTAH